MNTRINAGYFTPSVAGAAVVAWAALFWLHGTAAVHHEHLHGSTPFLIFGHQTTASSLEWAATFLAGWCLMTVAMMLPTTLPMVSLFRQMTRPRPGQGGMVVLLLAGYLVIWSAFGVVVGALALAVGRWLPFLLLPDRLRLVGPALFLIAGFYQFLPFKRSCLERCHSPLDYDACRWSDDRPMQSSLAMGARHGLSCVGCCWALMLLMFAAGSAHLAWMLALTAVIMVEKTLPQGRQLAKPMGVVLLFCAVFFVLQ